MATSEVEMKESEVQLKHLSFVKILAINAAVVVANLYDYAKQNSGPLKSAVGKVEDAVTAAVGPVYRRFKGVPSDVLVFLDTKVDELTYKFDKSAPPAAKIAVYKARAILQKASELGQDLAEEARTEGPLAAVSHVAKISKEFTVSQVAIIWYKANHYPALHGVFEIAMPTATLWSKKYNSLVKDLTAKGYSLIGYFPLVPVEEMEKAYKQVSENVSVSEKVDAGSSSESGSDKE